VDNLKAYCRQVMLNIDGEQFYAKAGQVIALPDRKADRPHREFLEWHLSTVFNAS